jgi:hypothetical protein
MRRYGLRGWTFGLETYIMINWYNELPMGIFLRNTGVFPVPLNKYK